MARILMFSGGMDSFILKSLLDFKNNECLFVDMGTIENQEEKKFLAQYFPNIKSISLSIASWEMENKIIPFRNNFLALVGAQYAQQIYFAFTAGDTTRDKDYVFKSQMEGILNYFSQSEDKVRYPGPYQLKIPFKQMTKTQIVTAFIEKGFDPSLLLTQSHSCYSEGVLPCGKCRSCLRKFVALTLNNIQCLDFFKQNPMDYLQEFAEESKKKERKQELKEIYKCMELLFSGDRIIHTTPRWWL